MIIVLGITLFLLCYLLLKQSETKYADCIISSKRLKFNNIFFILLCLGPLLGVFLDARYAIISCLYLPVFVSIAYMDFISHIIPDRFHLIGFLVVVFHLWFNKTGSNEILFNLLVGGSFIGIVYFVTWIAEKKTKKELLGGGDIKLLLWLTPILGGTLAVFFLFGLTLALLHVMVLSKSWGQFKKIYYPLGPYLCLSILINLVYQVQS